jgi:hypothetical protein
MQTNRPDDDTSQAASPVLSKFEIQLARRRFLLRCGRYAAVTPPLVTLLLAPDAAKYAAAQSGVGPRMSDAVSSVRNVHGGGAMAPSDAPTGIADCRGLAPGSWNSNAGFCAVAKKERNDR